MSLQVTYPELPWIKSNAALPQGINGDKFDSKTSLLLSILTEKEGYEVPIYMTLDDIKREISRLISAKKVSVCQMGRLCKQYIILSKPIFLWNIPRNGSNLENHVRFLHRNKLL